MRTADEIEIEDEDEIANEDETANEIEIERKRNMKSSSRFLSSVETNSLGLR